MFSENKYFDPPLGSANIQTPVRVFFYPQKINEKHFMFTHNLYNHFQVVNVKLHIGTPPLIMTSGMQPSILMATDAIHMVYVRAPYMSYMSYMTYKRFLTSMTSGI